MLVYMPSYPRSGNSWVQQVITSTLRVLTTDDSDPRTPPANWDVLWGLEKRASTPSEADAHLVWNDWTATYEADFIGPDGRKETSGSIRRRFLLPGFYANMTREERVKLAAEPDLFFVKTHDLPPEEFVEGEHILHILRHPGPAVLSYFKLLNRQRAEGRQDNVAGVRPVTMDEVIEGEVNFGSWAQHTAAWRAAEAKVGDHHMLVQYESLLENEMAVAQRIGQRFGLNPRAMQAHRFEDLKKQNYGRSEGRGTNEAFEAFFTDNQLSRMAELYASEMEAYGYSFEPSDQRYNGFELTYFSKGLNRMVEAGRAVEEERLSLVKRLEESQDDLRAVRASRAKYKVMLQTQTERAALLEKANAELVVQRRQLFEELNRALGSMEVELEDANEEKRFEAPAPGAPRRFKARETVGKLLALADAFGGLLDQQVDEGERTMTTLRETQVKLRGKQAQLEAAEAELGALRAQVQMLSERLDQRNQQAIIALDRVKKGEMVVGQYRKISKQLAKLIAESEIV